MPTKQDIERRVAEMVRCDIGELHPAELTIVSIFTFSGGPNWDWLYPAYSRVPFNRNEAQARQRVIAAAIEVTQREMPKIDQ